MRTLHVVLKVTVEVNEESNATFSQLSAALENALPMDWVQDPRSGVDVACVAEVTVVNIREIRDAL